MGLAILATCTMNVCLLWFTFNSLNSGLHKIEKVHGITRWPVTDVNYIRESQLLEMDVKMKLLKQLQQDSYERDFLISLLKKYSGQFTQMTVITLCSQ
jgi:hypothetical protein